MPVRINQRDQILQATDLVQLIGEVVALKARGREYLGLCPFHDDKRPSMHVSPAKQIYKCFSCGAGGTAFDFMIHYHKMTFVEALKFLADRAGITLEQGQGAKSVKADGSEEVSDRQLIGDANARAVSFYRALLRHAEHGKTARDYIERRGISREMVEAFQIGYAPDRWDGLVLTIEQNQWNRRAFELAGLISPRDSHSGSVGDHSPSFYDRLRHRLIFPICDQLGRPIAFGGRRLREEDEPKYLNSPETALFNKSATLFGIHLAKKPIIDSKTAVIVEGYTDVIACHQYGASNVVATLGTALTLEHVAVLRRFAEKVVLVFDADEAGQKAADRALELFLSGEVDVFIAVLPDGLDPADLLAREDGLVRWREAIDAAEDALSYQFERVRRQFDAAETMTARQRLMEEYIRTLSRLGLQRSGVIRRAMVVQRVSELLHVDEAQVNTLLRKVASRNALAGSAVRQATDNSPTDANNVQMDVGEAETGVKIKALQIAEGQLIGALLRYPAAFHQMLTDGRTLDEAISASDMATAAGALLYQRLYNALADHETPALTQLLADLAAEDEHALVRYVTRVEAEVEELDGGDEQRGCDLARQAAESLLRYRGERAYAEARQAFLNLQERGDTALDPRHIRELQEKARANQSPVRIKRM